jgi:hypothetical protein
MQSAPDEFYRVAPSGCGRQGQKNGCGAGLGNRPHPIPRFKEERMDRIAKLNRGLLVAVVFVVVGASLSAQFAVRTQGIMQQPPHKLFVLVDNPKPCGLC